MSETEIKTDVETPEGEEQQPSTEPEWLKADGEQPGTIPAVAHMRIKEKLKTRVAERDDKITQLEQKIAQLEQSRQPAPSALQQVARPKRADFEEDDAYYEAMDRYMDESLEDRYTRLTTQQTQERRQRREQQTVRSAVDSHYERVDKLIADSGLSEEVYIDSHRNVEQAIGQTLGVDGGPIMSQFISTLGEGSEKAVVFVGRNQAAMAQFKTLLADDPSGLKAAAYLGAETQRLNNTTRSRSNAPAPATEIPGGDAPVVGEGAYLKRYEDAHKKGDVGAALNAKLDAKKAGADVSGW